MDLNNAIETTARNCDSIDLLNMVAADSDVQTLADKVDELLQVLKRNRGPPPGAAIPTLR